jgi:hypothetical protein
MARWTSVAFVDARSRPAPVREPMPVRQALVVRNIGQRESSATIVVVRVDVLMLVLLLDTPRVKGRAISSRIRSTSTIRRTTIDGEKRSDSSVWRSLLRDQHRGRE